jgi:hypothetical protein
MTGTPPSLLLHPPDFLGREDDGDMAYFPGMKMTRASKQSIVRWALKLYSETFDVRCMIDSLRLMDPKLMDASIESIDSNAAANRTADSSVTPLPLP